MKTVIKNRYTQIVIADSNVTLIETVVQNKTRLHDANLRYADLSGADLRGADLHDANLRGADLRYVVFKVPKTVSSRYVGCWQC